MGAYVFRLINSDVLDFVKYSLFIKKYFNAHSFDVGRFVKQYAKYVWEFEIW